MVQFGGVHALVIGAGASGVAASRLLLDGGAEVRISEQRQAGGVDLSALEGRTVDLRAGGHADEHLDGIDLVVVSPGVPPDAPIMTAAASRGIRIVSELELAAPEPGPYVAVTGTNGKTTTTEMIAAAMRASGLDAVACGNIGHPLSTAIAEGHEALAIEASSFQLHFTDGFHPRVSVLLNVAPDHLDWHGSLEAYATAKARIFRLQGAEDTHVGNADDPAGRAVSEEAPCPIVWFRLGEPDDGEVGFVGNELVARLGTEARLGVPTSSHLGFRADAAAAAAAAVSFGLPADAVAEGIASISPLPHRGQVVAKVGRIEFVDDSKATNPHAVLASLAGRERVVLIAGGLAKGLDLSPIADAAERISAVVAFGDAASQVEDLFSGIRPVRRAESIEQAADLALELALASDPPGGCVVLAPGGASQDLFVDYRERGERFAQAARRLQERQDG